MPGYNVHSGLIRLLTEHGDSAQSGAGAGRRGAGAPEAGGRSSGAGAGAGGSVFGTKVSV